MALNSHIRKELSNISNLNFHHRILEEDEIKSKVSPMKIMKIRLESNKIRNRKSIEKITETKSWFFEKFNKIDKPLDRLTKEKEGWGRGRRERESGREKKIYIDIDIYRERERGREGKNTKH